VGFVKIKEWQILVPSHETIRRVEVQLHILLISAVDGGD
jgi:hypothetical protein